MGIYTMQKSLLSDKVLESSAHALSGLQRSLGISLRLCLFTGTWCDLHHRMSAASDTPQKPLSIDISALPLVSLNSPEPFLLPVSTTSHVFGIPLESTPDGVVYAAGESDSGLTTLLRAVSIQSQQIRELREQSDLDSQKFDRFSDQILRSFEERSWQLKLTEDLSMCEVNHSLRDLLQNLLPRLRCILCAESLAFLPETSSEDLDAPVVETILPEDAPVRKLKLREIVNRFRSQAMAQPFVRNWDTQGRGVECLPGLHSLMIVCVSKQSVVVGWLLALNAEHNLWISPRLTTDPDEFNFSDSGFGTAEAGLLKSAASAIATHHHNRKLFQLNQRLTVGVVRSLANAVDARDTYTHGHSDRVARLGQHLARRCGASAELCEKLPMIGLLHDIGKISVPDHILLKKSSLTNEEFEIIKRHPLVGYQILQHIQELEFTLDGVLYHHEAWDGSGYPLGRTGQNIPLVARLLAVVDSFDAMTSSRPYRTGMSFEKAESILRDGAGTQWDPDLVSIFLQYKEEFRRICQDSATHFQSIDTIDLNALYANPHSRELNAVTKPVMAEASV